MQTVIDKMNEYANMIPSISGMARRINTTSGDESIVKLGGADQKWLGVVEEHHILNPKAKTPEPQTVQFRLFQSESLDGLEHEINTFCDKHEVKSIKLMIDEKKKAATWAVIVTYAVAG